MAVRDNILQFRPLSRNDDSRSRVRARSVAVKEGSDNLANKRAHRASAGRTSEPQRVRTLERSRVPQVSSAAETSADSRTSSYPQTQSSTAEPRVTRSVPYPQTGARLVQPFQAFGTRAAVATTSSASIALPLDTPWPSPVPQRKTGRGGSRERATRPTRRVEEGRTRRANNFLDAEDLRSVFAGLIERVRSISNGVLIALICVVVSAVFLYDPVRELYQAKRTQHILTTRLEQISSDNEQLQHSVNSLQTREGIEDEARKRGLVNAGETSVEVDGLEDYKNAQKVSLNQLTKGYEDTSEVPFYLKALDFVFQYDPSA